MYRNLQPTDRTEDNIPVHDIIDPTDQRMFISAEGLEMKMVILDD